MKRKNRTYHPRRVRIDGYACQSHPIYAVWSGMMARCYSPGNPSYPDYGGRGIKVDPAWHHFRNFAKDMGIRPGDEWSIERRDNNAGYSKSNCVWAIRSDQCVNRRLFKTNTSGTTGVVKLADRQWEARFDYLGIRYRIGRYVSKEKAIAARVKFTKLFSENKEGAVLTLTPKDQVVWNNSSTKCRGVCPHADGRGYIARCTVDGVRHYVGYFTTIEEAQHARSEFIKEQTRGTRV